MSGAGNTVAAENVEESYPLSPTQPGPLFDRLASPHYPRSQCLPELFEAQVERTPNTVALVYGKEEVSYRELDNQANRVSRHLRSLSIARGVRNRPALTAERLIPDPFGASRRVRLEKTGDHVRWGADGDLELLGRLDDPVKIRGRLIEPGEIESRLNRQK